MQIFLIFLIQRCCHNSEEIGELSLSLKAMLRSGSYNNAAIRFLHKCHENERVRKYSFDIRHAVKRGRWKNSINLKVSP